MNDLYVCLMSWVGGGGEREGGMCDRKREGVCDQERVCAWSEGMSNREGVLNGVQGCVIGRVCVLD